MIFVDTTHPERCPSRYAYRYNIVLCVRALERYTELQLNGAHADAEALYAELLEVVAYRHVEYSSLEADTSTKH